MAFGINDKEVVQGFGANDVVVSKGFGSNDKVVTPPVSSPPEDLTKPAFVAPRQRATELKKVQAAAVSGRDESNEGLTWNDLTTNPSLQDIQKQFLQIRTGKKVEGISGVELSNQFMSSARADEWNTFNNIAYLNQLRNSPMPDKEKLALGKLVFERTKSALEEGGQPGARPYVDAVTSAFTDLTNYVGIGVGAGLKKVAAKEATKAATRAALGEVAETGVKAKLAQAMTVTPLKAGLGVVGTEGVIGAGQAAVEQKAQVATSKVLAEQRPDLGVAPKEFDNTSVAVAALFSATFGGVEAVGIMKAKPGKSGAEQLNDVLKEKIKTPTDPNAPPTKVERVLTDPVAQNMDKVVEEFMNIQGGRILDEINPATALTDAKIQKDLSARAVRVALHVIEQDPTFRLRPNQKTSTAIAEVFSQLDTIDDALLEQAIRKEGLTPDEFAAANKLTVTEAAQVMQQYSAASKVLKRMSDIDPEFKKQIDALFEKPDEYVSALGRVGQGIQTLERESKAWIVSGIGTTVRNIIGTSVGLTYNSAASLIEGALYTVGRTLDGAASGKRIETAKNSLGDTMRDAFGVYGYMAKGGLSTEVTDTLLQHNPAIRNNILSATQEGSTKEISKAAQVFNSLNVAQDAFFRKAIFNASVEKNMRRAGLDMYQVIADGKTIPASVLKEAADETLKATFSYTPKVQKKGIQTFEAGAEAAGNLFVKAAEFPGGSLLATFPRFMSNAIAFQYRYSVFGAMSGAEDLAQGTLLKAAGSSGGDALIRKGQQNIAKGVVGTAALAAAYDYRLNNQDTEWYNMKNDDGSTIDTRAIFPLGPTLAVADFMAKRKLNLEPKTAEAMEAIVGMKMPAGTQNQFLDQVFAAFSSEKEADKVEVAVGKVIGDFTARFAQPFVFKSAYEFFDLFREEGAIQRDPNVLTAEGGGGRLVEAAANRVQSKLPVLKEQLPEAIPRLREGPVYKEGEFFNSLIGVRETPNKTPAEKEIVRLGIDPFKLYGPSSGDRLYDRAFVENANPMVVTAIDRTMSNERYKALSPTEQKLALSNVVRDVTGIARDKTDGKFMSEDLTRVKKMRFDKLSADQRKVINERYAKDNNGVTLEEAKDYRAVDKYEAMLGNLAFAKGGLVPAFAAGGLAAKVVGKKLIGEAAQSVTSKLKSITPTPSAADNTAIDAIISKELGTTSPAIDQTANMLMGSKPVLPKPAAKSKPMLPEKPAKPAPTTPEAPVLSQTEQALPTPPPQVMEAPTPSKAFADEDYIKGEEAMMDLYTPEQLKSWKIANPEDYENTLHSFTGQAKGLKYSEMPPQPFAKKTDEAAESLVDEVEYDMDGNPVSVGGNVVAKKAEPIVDDYGVDPKYLSGDTNAITGSSSISARNKAVAAIKETREDSFFKLRNNDKFAAVDDDVLGVVLGDYRYSRGVELNPKDPAMIDDAMKMASQYQNRLDGLREKYKDVPPVKLFHGQGGSRGDIEGIKKSGFVDPTKRSEFHSEMYVGAPSFTKDLNLGFRATPFGGTDPKNYVVTEIPYADYVFNKINMAPEKYDRKDMNTILRAVTGAPGVVRPIGLPRAGFLETEDMMLEAEKLRVKGRNAKLRSAKTDVSEALQRGGKDVVHAEVKKDEELISEYMKTARNSNDPKERMKMAYMSYSGIKDLMNSYIGMGKVTSTKTGLGQQYQAAINFFADYSGIQRQMREVGDILWDGGAKQKAQNLYELSDKLKKFQQTEPSISTAVDEAKRTKPLNEVTKMIPKLAKGGLASRR
jgi:hypothetical protein